ncbi:MAG: YggT family protein [Kordiimonadaceae bacterium]|jgi:YggT family protein|nr:YggT family protein [Gammaproteobacteria bacterium]MBT5074074.1 YggT family protein [Kordiimonadaceae bacterium]MBT6034966.1 YggT family protein [Kordiimonadaceae bacterium]MBT6329256.1 YggT family protein [Kordiimonadaceae bacterium]MBT7581995.1 YggT family protein [Kordiimonadaceae bacterium]
MGNFAYLLADLIMGLSGIISFLLFIYIIISILISFNVINSHNQFVNIIFGSLYKLFEPILRPIRNVLPDLGGMDFSPIIVFFALRYGTPFIAEAIIQLA